MDRDDLNGVMAGEATFQGLVVDGTATIEGDLAVMQQLMSMLVTFTPDFEMMPGTKGDGRD